MKSWGQEVLIDCRKCNDAIKDDAIIRAFIADLCESIGMIRVGDPVLVHIDDLGDKNGWTAFQMIKTSAVVAHFCDNGEAYFDVFSCKEIKEDVVSDIVSKWFSPSVMYCEKIDRGCWI